MYIIHVCIYIYIYTHTYIYIHSNASSNNKLIGGVHQGTSRIRSLPFCVRTISRFFEKFLVSEDLCFRFFESGPLNSVPFGGAISKAPQGNERGATGSKNPPAY